MKKVKQEKGITLIALVITIIVLLILAGVAISMLSGENGILTRASEAKTQTENKSEEEQVKLAATEAMMKSTDYTVTKENLETILNEKIGVKDTDYKISDVVDGWEVEVVKTGKHYSVMENGTTKYLTWYYTEDGTQITNGKQTLTLLDKIEYDPTAGLKADENGVYKEYTSLKEKNGNSDQEFKLINNEEQKLEWRVLGTDEDGNVLIIPTTCIKDEDGEDKEFLISEDSATNLTKAKSVISNIVNEINKIASIYGYGTGAKSARSIKLKDTEKYLSLENNGDIEDYGNKVTYKLNENGKIEYSWYKDGELQGPTESENTSFTYLDGDTWKTLEKNQSVTITSSYKFASIKNLKFHESIWGNLNATVLGDMYVRTQTR